MTKGREIVNAIVARLRSASLPVDAIYDTRILEAPEKIAKYIVVGEEAERVEQPAGQILTPLKITTGVLVTLVSRGRDATETGAGAGSALAALDALQEAVEVVLVKKWDTLNGILDERMTYTGASVSAAADGDDAALVRSLRFDAVWYREVD